MLSHKKSDSVINVKVELGEGKIWIQGTYRIYRRGKEEFRFADVRCLKYGRRIETDEEASNSGEG